jgi:hypothetical protein
MNPGTPMAGVLMYGAEALRRGVDIDFLSWQPPLENIGQ